MKQSALRVMAVIFASLIVSACFAARPPAQNIYLHLSPPILTFGVVADTQLQNREGWAARSLLRSPKADKKLPVTIRPPALDAAARALLRAHLSEQRLRGVSAIFYLGDGSNQGCISELNGKASGSEGIFPMLTRFRDESGIPVFFVLGNHDFLAAGNSENQREHATLCGGADNVVTKAALIRLADELNRVSAARAAWVFSSSPAASLEDHCFGSGQMEIRQSRRHGCYYAAALDVESGGTTFRFLLLDTNDYADVSRNRVLAWGGNTPLTTDFEGLRGAMSFRDSEGAAQSQTGWLAARGRESRDAGRVPDVLVALTHYDIPALRKALLIPLSQKTQLISNVFADERTKFFGQRVFVVSAHTHTSVTKTQSTTILRNRVKFLRLEELNIGSTTDYPSLSAVLRIVPSPSGPMLSYEALTPDRRNCGKVMDELAAATFPRTVLGERSGGRSIAFDTEQPLLYHEVTAEAADLFANIDWFVGSSDRRAVCLGLAAGAVEAGAQPLSAPPM